MHQRQIMPSVPGKAIFNVRVSTTNPKMTYEKVVLCPCVRGIYKFCIPRENTSSQPIDMNQHDWQLMHNRIIHSKYKKATKTAKTDYLHYLM